MERYSGGERPLVVPARGQNTALIIIMIIVIIAILVIAVIFARRRFDRGPTRTGTGSTECVSNLDCTGNQVCNPNLGLCVDCIDDGDCTSEAPLCDISKGRCVGCVTDEDCPSNKPICDPDTKFCVQCETNDDCGLATPLCNPATKRCVGCLSASDCGGTFDICDPANNSCVQCTSNSDCIFPELCFNGQCCDLTEPEIDTLGAAIVVTPSIGGTYIASQSNLSDWNVVYEVSDSTGFVLFTSIGEEADGSISIVQPTETSFPTYYSGYTYQVRARLISACGSTDYSDPMDVVIPFPVVPYLFPVILTVTVDLTDIVVWLTFPNSNFFGIYTVSIFISETPDLDPNRAIQATNIVSLVAPPFLIFVGPWPIGVSSGEEYYIRVAGRNGVNFFVISDPFMVTVP